MGNRFVFMLTVKNLSLQAGDRHILNGVSFSLKKGQRVGLVGRNGQGKSTLLQVICGKREDADGTVKTSRDFSVAYLPQEVVSAKNMTMSVFEEAKRAFDHVFRLKRRVEELEKKLSSLSAIHPSHEAMLAAHDRLSQKLEQADFYRIKGRIEAILFGLGFRKDQLHRTVSSLSGGWIMRLELAKLLLSRPDLILLDEPTNHLDLPSLAWLEEFLAAQDSGCLIVSHDRTFLDKTVQEIWELENGRLTFYQGNYSFYEEQRGKRLRQKEAAWKNQQKKIDELNQFIQRFRAKATKARQVQSRIKQLQKMELVDAPQRAPECTFCLPDPPRAGKIVLEVQDLSKRYGEKVLFERLSFMLKRGSKLAVVGPNGAGKSTLLKLLAGRLEAENGKIILGHKVTRAYFAQHQVQQLQYEKSVLSNIICACPGVSETRLRTILGIFMFRGEDVSKKVSVLSGGEKSRLALAIIMAKEANLLLLDEPTNHLDMDAQEAVRDALQAYKGSVVVVSHNRYFLDGFVDQVLEIEEGKISLFPGNVSQFLETKKAILQEGAQDERRPKQGAKENVSNSKRRLTRRQKKRLVAQIRQEKSRALMPFRQKAQKLEDKILLLENERDSIERQLSDASTYTDTDKAATLNRRYKVIREELEDLYLGWEEACTRLDEMEQAFDKKILEIEEDVRCT